MPPVRARNALELRILVDIWRCEGAAYSERGLNWPEPGAVVPVVTAFTLWPSIRLKRWPNWRRPIAPVTVCSNSATSGGDGECRTGAGGASGEHRRRVLIVDAATRAGMKHQLGEFMALAHPSSCSGPADRAGAAAAAGFADDALGRLEHPIPFCADESFRTLADLAGPARREIRGHQYQAFLIKWVG